MESKQSRNVPGGGEGRKRRERRKKGTEDEERKGRCWGGRRMSNRVGARQSAHINQGVNEKTAGRMMRRR